MNRSYTLILFALCACSSSGSNASKDGPQFGNNKTSLSYQFVENGCDTGKHIFSDKASYCDALTNDELNNHCAASLRAQDFARNCNNGNQPTPSEEKPGEVTNNNSGQPSTHSPSTSTPNRNTYTRMPFSQISTPDDMVQCMKKYIQDWGTAGGSISSWEHEPAFNFAGKSFTASWHTYTSYGILSMTAAPSSLVNCGYETKENGIPDLDKGFCKATATNGDVQFDLSYGQPGEKSSKVKVADVQDSKIRCLGLPRP